MPLTRPLTRFDHPTQQTVGEALDQGALLALSQRKLNALGFDAGREDDPVGNTHARSQQLPEVGGLAAGRFSSGPASRTAK